MADQDLIRNRKAFHDYQVLETVEAGIVLLGSEVKSCRARTLSIGESFAKVEKGQVKLYGMHIAEYPMANRNNHEPLRTRQLLLQKKQIRKLTQQTGEKGFTLVPLAMYLKHGLIKVALGVCRGKATHDKRETLKQADAKRSMQQALKLRDR